MLEGDELRDYLCREVETICDADPALVAQYITALIGAGEPPNILRKSLEEKLNEFFGDQTLPFIDRLFKTLGYDESQPSENTSERNPPSDQYPSRRRLSDYSDDEDDGDRNFKHRRPRTETREDTRYSRHHAEERHQKRRYPDNGHGYGSNKQLRGDDYRGARGGAAGIPQGPAAMYSGSSQQQYDSNRGRGGGRGYRGEMTNTTNRQRPLCRDYNEKGFCMRGDMCPYDHGADRIVVDDGSFSSPFPAVSTPMGGPIPPSGPQQPFFGIPSSFDAYDPERATLMPNGANLGAFPVDMSAMMIPQDNIAQNRMFGNVRGGMRGRGGGRGRGRGGMSMGGYQQNRQNTMLVVENIPAEYCEISKINDFFKKFGSITNISVQAHLNKAILQFSSNAEASAAYNSPDPIFDNRFVKVYWYKEKEEDVNKTTSAAAAETARPPKSEVPQKRSNEPDPEEVAARAAELAKQREEKQRKHQERMKAILELQKQKEQLLQKQIEEQKRLMDKLANAKNMSPTEKEELLKSLRKIAADIDTSKSSVSTTTTSGQPSSTAAAPEASASGGETSEDLKAKLARLEAEAASLGIPTHGGSFAPPSRGGFYGRGRGWPRMRGGFARYTLDNRPTKIYVKDVPEEQKDAIRKHFEQFGRVSSFESHETGIVVGYVQRFEAEKAMAGGAHGPNGNLEMTWFTGTPSNNTAQQQSGAPQQSTTTAAPETSGGAKA